MSEHLENIKLEKQVEPEVVVEAVGALASAFHEEWRKTRLNEDGSFEPRMKETKDASWIAEHGTNQVDISNTAYDQLPEDWQAENKAAAEVVVGLMVDRNGQVDLSDSVTRSEVGGIVHDAWLNRNSWASGGELDVPFDQLPADEQAKDINQVEIAQELFGTK